MMRIVHLSTIHRPDDVRIFQKECRTLAAMGYEVHFVVPTAVPEHVSGVALHPFSVPQLGNRVLRIWNRWQNAYRVTAQLDPDVCHFHDPELIPVGVLLRWKGIKVIYDVHENAPKQAFHMNPQSRGRAVTYWLIWMVLEAVAKLFLDRFVCATPSIARRFPRDRTISVHNFPLSEEFSHLWKAARTLPVREQVSSIVYVGNVFLARGVLEMVDAMDLVPSNLGARLQLAGKFTPPELQGVVEQLPGWQHVDYLGWQDRDQVVETLRRARVGLVLLHPTPQYKESYPVKLFEYMAAGLPVVASDFPLWRKIVEGGGCGIVTDPLNRQSIAAAIQYLLEHPREAEEMGRRGQELVRNVYNWEGEADKLTGLYRQLEGV